MVCKDAQTQGCAVSAEYGLSDQPMAPWAQATMNIHNTKAHNVISHHAPKGYIAIAHAGGLPCQGCAFKYDSLCPNVRGVNSCTPTNRKDGQLVIFVKTV